MAALSVIIITYNEEKNIARCIGSVQQLADEVIVLDSFSRDRTTQIASEMGAKCYHRAFSGYGDQKNAAGELGTHEFLLYLDADEYLSPELYASMLEEKERGFPCDGYFMNRLSKYCGRWIRHCSWYPDRKLRLVRRNKAAWNTELVHESLDPAQGAILGGLKGDLLHLPYADHESHVAKINTYSTLSAKRMYLMGKKPTLWKLLFSPPASFFSGYIIHAGFLDGLPGFMISIHSAYYTFLKYAKLRQLSIAEAARPISPDNPPALPSSAGSQQRTATAGAAPWAGYPKYADDRP